MTKARTLNSLPLISSPPSSSHFAGSGRETGARVSIRAIAKRLAIIGAKLELDNKGHSLIGILLYIYIWGGSSNDKILKLEIFKSYDVDGEIFFLGGGEIWKNK